MAGEIGTAYVKVELDPSGISVGLERTSQETTDAFEQTGKDAGESLKKGMLIAGAALTGIAVFAKQASDSTIQLARDTMGLSRATGIATETASAYVSVLATRGIDVSQFRANLVVLSRQMEDWRKKGSAAESMLKDLGVSFDAVKRGDVNEVFLQVADALAKIENPAQRAAVAQKLFGRSGQALLPVLTKGRKGIQESLDKAKEFGATISEDTVADVQKLTEAQRDLQLAQTGVKNSIGSALIPAQAQLWGALDQTVQKLLPVTKNADVMTGLLAAGVVVWGAYKAAVVATTIAESRQGIVSAALAVKKIALAAATGIATAAQWALNVATSAWPILLVVAGVIALAAAFVFAWKKSETFRKIVTGAWDAIKKAAGVALDFIRKNWQYLLAFLVGGPFLLAVVAVIKNWDKIKDAAGRAWAAVKSAAKNAVDAIRGFLSDLPSRAYQLALDVGRRIASGILDGLGDLASSLKGKVGGAINAVVPGNPLGLAFAGPMEAAAAGGRGVTPLAGGAGGGLAGPVPVGQRLRRMLGDLDRGGLEAQQPSYEVRVYIGDQELKGIVRSEVVEQDSRTARVILSGAGAS